MDIIVDTNAFVRFFTLDEPEKARKIEKLLEKENLFVPDVVFPELEYILVKTYKSSRQELITSYKSIVERRNIKTSSQVKIAIDIFEQTKLDMADCIIAAYSLSGKLASFDNELLQTGKVKPYWKK